jgi:Mlc titration factor MtfA (ptsG expression regulator)
VHTVLVHPTTLVLQGEHSQVQGIVSDGPMPILGQADLHGPVLIVWDAVLDEARHPGSGHNVVFHEFAHRLDMLTGEADGTPPMSSVEQSRRWVEVCTRVYGQVVEGRGGTVLRSYAGVNPAEFFAVSTEAFFDAPVELRRQQPDLYEVLRDYYGQDPATRWS